MADAAAAPIARMEAIAVTDITIRPATTDDLAAVWDIVYAHEAGGAPNPPPRGDVPPFLQHELATGDMRVAALRGQVVGFGAAITRDSLWYLAELFVRRELQSAGIGAALLRELLPADGRVRFTRSSSDPRALALYVRAGMRPCWPNVWLRARSADVAPLPTASVRVVPASGDDAELRRWDAELSGRARDAEHDYWLATGATPVWFARPGCRLGYGFLQTDSGSAIWSRQAITLGPIGTQDVADAAACVCAAVEWARRRVGIVRMVIPGPHPALAPLLAAGFRITDVETFVSSAVPAFVDPTRYVGSGDFF